ncbi:glycosyltransferase family 4 protein [Paenibacillus sp. P26]|nr:glycosyltransferase family 4 protein [Paenibacillus sp. P26]
MKIAFYNHTSDISGAEISLLLTAKHLKKATPVLFAPEGDLLERARKEGIETVSIPSYRARMTKNPLMLLKHILGMLWAGLLFAGRIRKHSVQIIHANSLRAGIMAALFAWFHRRPVVWHVRDNPPQGLIGKATQQLASIAVKAILCISNSVVEGFDQQKLGDKIHLAYNGIPIRDMSVEEKAGYRKSIREQLETPLDSNVMVIVGQIALWKRQEDAIRAAHQLIAGGHDVYLWVVGEPKFREENEKYWKFLHELAAELKIADRVRFTGFREDVLEICTAADFLLLCSDNEPFGRVVIEAMSQSVPVIATNAGGPREILVDGYCGFLYETGNVEQLTKHASSLIKNPSLRQEMGRLALKRVRENFTKERTIEVIETVYQDILSPHDRTRYTASRKASGRRGPGEWNAYSHRP